MFNFIQLVDPVIYWFWLEWFLFLQTVIHNFDMKKKIEEKTQLQLVQVYL